MALEHGEITEQNSWEQRSRCMPSSDTDFFEKVYQKAMQVELIARGLKAETESKIKVAYKGTIVGDYQADLLVADHVIVELKIAKEYQPADEAQLLKRTQGHWNQGRVTDQLRSYQSRVQTLGLLKTTPGGKERNPALLVEFKILEGIATIEVK